MGWTTTYKAKSESAKEYIEKNLLKWNSPKYTYTVLDGGVVKFRTYYGAVDKVDNETGERQVFAVVILLSYHKDGYYNFGYKDMDETCGPSQAECPERILKLLTPTESKYANDWRNRCWENINSRKNKPKIEVGNILRYGDKDYKVTKILGRRGFMVDDGYGNYRMKTTQAQKSIINPN